MQSPKGKESSSRSPKGKESSSRSPKGKESSSRSPKGKESSMRPSNNKKNHRESETYVVETKGVFMEELYGRNGNDSISFSSPQQSTISPNDIDYELRLKLKAIHQENLDNSRKDSKLLERQSQLLTARLDSLQRELDAKNKIILQFDIMRNEMKKKKDENLDLQGKLFHFEKDTIMLQQELSVMRTSQKEILKPKERNQLFVSHYETMNDISPLKPFTTSMNRRVRSPFGQKNVTTQSKFLSTPKKSDKNENSLMKNEKVLSSSKKQIRKSNNENEKLKNGSDVRVGRIFPLKLYEIEESTESVKSAIPETNYSTQEDQNFQFNEDKENSKKYKINHSL